MKNVYTIPAGIPFAKALAKQLLAETKDAPEKLSGYRILLPTRRACRTLQEAFLQLSSGKPLLLPNMQPIGDLDEEELSFSFFKDGEALNLPQAITPLKRQLLLARTIQSIPGYVQGPEQAINLAEALGQLLDQIIIEECDIANLNEIVPEDFADHWQITLDFLKILSEHWPKILKEENVVDSAERRNRLIKALAQHWGDHPPEEKVIAAGSTGSIPATAALLSTIAGLPQGRVVLPGLDQMIDEESWQVLDESHPQHGLKHLLDTMNLERESVRLWPGCEVQESQSRHILASEMMRPAATTSQWEELATSQQTGHIKELLQGLQKFECDNEAEEASLIALLLREALQDKTRTAALVTPDRKLARRVATTCQRWGITLDDSAGQALTQTRVGTFLRLSINACLSQFSPVPLLALLRHDFCSLNQEYDTLRKIADNLELMSLRGLRPKPGLSGIKERLQEASDDHSSNLLDQLEPVTGRFMNLVLHQKPQKFADFLINHIEMAEMLATTKKAAGMDRLWTGDGGEAAASFLTDLQSHAHLLPRVSASDYEKIITYLMNNITVRPSYGTHPRLMILGQLEARLVDADLMILGGLNEGNWPPDPGHDPWMSRPMRKDFGLPAPERSIGLAAHDFVQGFCGAPCVALTRAKRVEGAPTVPARWLQRLDTVLQAANIAPQELQNHSQLSWARQLDEHREPKPCERPAPTPPADKRPRQLSVTKIETWLQDPYSIYARYILGLKKLDPLDAQPGAKERGNLLHNILQHFVAETPVKLGPDAKKSLISIAQKEVEGLHNDPTLWNFWWPRFYNISDWLVSHETNWRQHVRGIKPEVEGKIQLDIPSKAFTLTARADRIDTLDNGKMAVIDYKSGGTYTQTGIHTGKNPQLSLEALILRDGGFQDVPAGDVDTLAYWKLTGGAKAGEVTKVDADVADIVARTQEGLENLIAVFDDPETPYYALPASDNIPRFQDYQHLARVKEWAALDDNTDEAA
ncbi:MAG: double-strand break repair protein AddB [Micavibrio sp.]|nr:MAG: double-strand break repair protein AddB [Micavibrio sp.]